MGLTDQVGQYPLNALGPAGQMASVGVLKVLFSGTGAAGSIATMYGIPGFKATQIATGSYQFTHPTTSHIDVIPGIECPTGTFYNVNVTAGKKGSVSGSFQVQLLSPGTGAGSASNTPQLVNPATGTVLKLMVFNSPITQF